MLEPFFFTLCLVNNIFLIIIFLLRKKYFSLLEKVVHQLVDRGNQSQPPLHQTWHA